PGDTFADALPHLQETYCGTIAYEIEHIADHRQRVWLRQTIESGAHREPLTPDEKRALLERLSQVEALESYLHKAFLGKKQFSIEGVDVLVPMLDETMTRAAGAGAREVVLGMAHRGRLNVLAHTVGRPYQTILVEFEGEQNLDADTAMPEGGTGDVKYHHGASGNRKLPGGKGITVTLSPNPSHLEIVDPVIDLIGYRRFGHNETDEPAYTQPVMYEKIKKHPPVRKLYADKLIEQGVVTKDEADAMAAEAYQSLADAHADLKASLASPGP